MQALSTEDRKILQAMSIKGDESLDKLLDIARNSESELQQALAQVYNKDAKMRELFDSGLISVVDNIKSEIASNNIQLFETTV